MAKRIIILGGGFGGVVVATELTKRLKRTEAEIILVDRASHYVYSPSYLWIMIGKRALDDISIPIERLRRRRVDVVHGEVERIDPVRREVVVSGQTMAADYLVVALGAETHMSGLEDITQAGANLYSSEGAAMLRDARAHACGKRIALLICSMPFKCPAAPYEAAMLLSWDLRAAQTGTKVALYSPEPGPMPVAGEKVSAQIVEVLTRRGVEYFPNYTVLGLKAPDVLQFQDGKTAAFDLLAYVPKHRVPRVLIEAGLAQEGGWAPVDRHTLQSTFPQVYVIGDAAGIPLKNGKALPKAGVFAHGQGEVVACNIAASVKGKAADHTFNGHGFCFVEMGGLMAGRGTGNFYAEPNPEVKLATPGPWNYWAKMLFEKYWLNFKY